MASAGLNTLGCGRYTAQVWTRGGGELIEADLEIASGEWTRVLSDTSTAKVALEGIGLEGSKCWGAIRTARALEFELALVRSGAACWQGPLLTKDSKFTSGNFDARDLSLWYDHRILPVDHDYTQVELSEIFNALALDAMLEDPSPNITVDATPTGVLGSRIYRAGNYLTAGPELRELTKAGVDWTFVLREALVGGIVVPAEPIVRLQDEDLAEAPSVREDGTAAANRVTVIGAGGGEQANPIVGQARDEESIAQFGLLDEVIRNDAIRDPESATAAAQSRLELVREPATIISEVVLSQNSSVLLEQLIPGAVVGCTFASSGIPVSDVYRLQQVKGTIDGAGEKITLSLQPLGSGGDES